MEVYGEVGSRRRIGLARLVLGPLPAQATLAGQDPTASPGLLPATPRVKLFQGAIALGLLVMALGVVALVYGTGGIKYVFSHTMYLVILSGGFCFGVAGGMVTGILAGVLLGPYMPIEVATGEMQATHNWLYRLLMFTVVGGLAGFFRRISLNYIHQVNWVRSHDLGTGLANKVQLHNLLRHRLHAGDRPLTLIVLHIGNLDDIEHAYGADSANQVLRELAEAISKVLGDRPAFRVNMHELVYVLELEDANALGPLLKAMETRLQEPFESGGFHAFLDTRIGYTQLAPSPDSSHRILARTLSAARTAMRESPKHVFAFSGGAEREAATKANLELLEDFQTALKSDQLLLYYQPKIELATGRVAGVEALVRWQHPSRGFISPGLFVPLVENCSLINDLTDWVLDTAIGQQRAWAREGIALTVALNISATDLAQPGFAEAVMTRIRNAGISPASVELEITESAIMDHFEQAIAALTELTAEGVGIAIDDFGTGHSSLRYLSRLPAATVKIDQSFVRELNQGGDAEHIVEAVTRLSAGLGKTTVAEGIEDLAALQYLTDTGCNYGQGYFISRPLPAAGFRDWFLQHEGRFPIAGTAEA